MKNKFARRVMASLLALAMLLSTLPFGAFAGAVYAADEMVIPIRVDASTIDEVDIAAGYEVDVMKGDDKVADITADGDQTIKEGSWHIKLDEIGKEPVEYTLQLEGNDDTESIDVQISLEDDEKQTAVVKFKESSNNGWQTMDQDKQVVPTFVLQSRHLPTLNIPVMEVVEGEYDDSALYLGVKVDYEGKKAVDEEYYLQELTLDNLVEDKATGHSVGADAFTGIRFKQPGSYELTVEAYDVPENYLCKTDAQTITVDVERKDDDQQLYITSVNGKAVSDDFAATTTVETPLQFVNQRITEDMDFVEVEIPVKKEVNGDAYPEDATFQIQMTPESGNARMPEESVLTVEGEDSASFVVKCYEAGEWVYDIQEVDSPDDFVYEEGNTQVKIVVEETEDGLKGEVQQSVTAEAEEEQTWVPQSEDADTEPESEDDWSELTFTSEYHEDDNTLEAQLHKIKAALQKNMSSEESK